MKGKIVASLDLGTTKLTCIIAEISNKNVRIVGYGYRKSIGISSSAITDMKAAQMAISRTIADAEKMAGFNIKKLAINISGLRLESSKKSVNNKVKGDLIKNSDIINLVSNIRSNFKNNKKEIIHLIPLEYKIDNNTIVNNPRDMSGDEISAKFCIISVADNVIKNVENCMKSSSISINNYISDVYAASLGVISKNELNFGTLVIDIGGGSASFSIVIDNKLHHIDKCKIGGKHVTRDIATILNINTEIAEKIKIFNNSLLLSPIEENHLIKFTMDDENYPAKAIELTKLELKNIMSARIEEIFNIIKDKLQKSGYQTHFINNIIISGGTANMIGIEKTAEKIFGKPATIGYPVGFKDLPKELHNPRFAVALGMITFLKQIIHKENRGDFEVKNNFIRKIIDYLMSV